MSCTDPHDVCLRCLGPRHDSASCQDCQAMTPKAQKQREQQLLLLRVLAGPEELKQEPVEAFPALVFKEPFLTPFG